MSAVLLASKTTELHAATPPRFDITSEAAPQWWWKARLVHPCIGATAMVALGLVLNTLGIGLFCWLIFALTVYALPFFAALSIGMLAFHGGAGVIGALLIGLASGALTLAVAQVAVAVCRSRTLRIVIATASTVPAAIAGYHVAFVLSQIGCLRWLGARSSLPKCGLHRRHGMDALDRFRGDSPVAVGRVAENMPRPVLTAATLQR